jgi:hypothetical protein
MATQSFTITISLRDAQRAQILLKDQRHLRGMFTWQSTNTLIVNETESTDDDGETWNQIMEILEENNVELY